jgi:hypothetical protein
MYDHEEITHLRAAGWSWSDIAETCVCPPGTTAKQLRQAHSRWLKRQKINEADQEGDAARKTGSAGRVPGSTPGAWSPRPAILDELQGFVHPSPFAVTYPHIAPPTSNDVITSVIYGDTHGQYIDPEAEAVLLSVLLDAQPDIVVHVGDAVDCPTPDMRVLTYDLQWVPAGDLQVGDEIIAFDEYGVGLDSAGRKSIRRLRRATVDKAVRIQQPVYALTLDDGRVVKSSVGHRWLGWKSNKNRAVSCWLTTQEIADRVAEGRPVLLHSPTRPWETRQETYADGLIRAAFDGEGCITFHKRANNFGHLSFSQRLGPFMDEVEDAVGSAGFQTSRNVVPGRSAQVLQVLGGMWDYARFIGTYRPVRFIDKWIERAPVDGYTLTGVARARVVAATYLGSQEVVAMETSAGTLFVEGVSSHNCYTLSAFDKDPLRKESLQDEIDYARAHLARVRAAVPDAHFRLLEGNHEDRLRRTLWRADGPAREVLKLREVRNVITWPTLLQLDDLGIEFVSVFDQPVPDLLPKFILKHGNVVRKWSGWSAKGEWERYGKSGASGHVHRLGMFFHRDWNGNHVWAETGCLCQLDPDYVRDPDWQNGFVVASFERSTGAFQVEPVYIHRGSAVWRGKVYRA